MLSAPAFTPARLRRLCGFTHARARRMHGFTLAEMMVGVAISLFLLTGLILAFTSASKSSSDTLRLLKGSQDLRGAMLLMGRDVRRAGYWANATTMVGSKTTVNPFAAINTAVAGCILFSYDQNSNGALDAAESFGYRLKNGVIEARTGGSTDDCNGAGNTWEALTEPNVNQVTALAFGLSEKAAAISGGGQMIVREVVIDAAAQLTRDASVKQTFSETIRIRNDAYRP